MKQWTGWAKPLNAWKYVGRALAAADVAFYMPAREAQAATLARTIAKAEGLSGNALEVRVSQLLGLRDQAGNDLRAEAEAMALVEAGDLENVGQRPDANWRARRIAQILDRGRLPELREQAHQYALRATFNNKPYGLLGVVAEAFNHARRNSKAINFVVPFVNVVANVTNESLNYTPVGTFRAILGHGGQVGNWRFGGELYGRPATATDVADLHAKAALGTALLGGLVALAAEGSATRTTTSDSSSTAPDPTMQPSATSCGRPAGSRTASGSGQVVQLREQPAGNPAVDRRQLPGRDPVREAGQGRRARPCGLGHPGSRTRHHPAVVPGQRVGVVWGARSQ